MGNGAGHRYCCLPSCRNWSAIVMVTPSAVDEIVKAGRSGFSLIKPPEDAGRE